jgi:hypothetical protein
MHLTAARPEAALMNRIVLGRDPATNVMQALHRPNCEARFLNHPGLRFLCIVLHRLETRLRGAAAPAARCGSGQWRRSEVLSVVPPGGSSEAMCSGRLRIDWNNRRALVRVTVC